MQLSARDEKPDGWPAVCKWRGRADQPRLIQTISAIRGVHKTMSGSRHYDLEINCGGSLLA
jgi:hypothetical protein